MKHDIIKTATIWRHQDNDFLVCFTSFRNKEKWRIIRYHYNAFDFDSETYIKQSSNVKCLSAWIIHKFGCTIIVKVEDRTSGKYSGLKDLCLYVRP